MWTNLYPSQRSHMRREVYRRTDINAEGTDVRSGSAADGQTAGRDIPGDEFSLCDVKDLDGARCAFNGNPFAGEVVESLAIVVDSGDHRGNLLNIPNKARQYSSDCTRSQRTCRFPRCFDAACILGGCGDAKGGASNINFGFCLDVWEEACGASDGDEKHSCCIRVKGAGMTNALGTKGLSDVANHIMGGPSGRFIDTKKSIHPAKGDTTHPRCLRCLTVTDA
jgi:hypothetical protein